MNNDHAFYQSLALIAEAAPHFQDDWQLIGSAAAKVAGADVGHINDVDLLLSKADIRVITEHWRDRPILQAAPSKQFRSEAFYRFDAPLPIEVMSGFKLQTLQGKWKPITPQTRVQFGDMFAPDIDEQIAILKLIGRPKDAPRIIALERLAPGNLYRFNK